MKRFIVVASCVVLSVAAFVQAQQKDRLSTQAVVCTTCPATTQPAVELADTRKFHIVSYNIERGDQFDAVCANIEQAHPDLVLLQEIPYKILQMLAEHFKMNYMLGPYEFGDYFGVGILAKGKLEEVKVFDMDGERNYGLAVKWTPANESKGKKSPTLFVVCTHLKSLERPVMVGLPRAFTAHTLQVNSILAEVEKQKLPAIVAGDFNTLCWTPEYRTMAAKMTDVAVKAKAQERPTIILGGGGYRIDYFFIKGDWTVRDYEVSPKPGSDHRMIQTVLELPLGAATLPAAQTNPSK
jgi:endonuclease/exonuclease/phosphatase (EEP) superfamily protein YafD